MKASKIIFIVFVAFGVLFIIGSVFGFQALAFGATLFMVPVLLLYYRFKTRNMVLPIVVFLVLFYVRDIFLLLGFTNYPYIILCCFFMGICLLLLCAITGMQKSKIHLIEYLSYFIMYGFLVFLLVSIGEIIPQVIPSHKFAAYLYLVLLLLFLAITFTGYLMKSHVASLWLMLGSASLLVSELSFFFKLFIIEDISVILFYPLFHIFAYYSIVQYALNRRETNRLPYF